MRDRPQPGRVYPVNYSWIFENEEVNGSSSNDGDRARREFGHRERVFVHPARVPRRHRKGVAEFGLHERSRRRAVGHRAKLQLRRIRNHGRLFRSLMRREVISPRPDAQAKVERLGLLFHTFEDQPYWYESAAYQFEPEEIATLEQATNTLHECCMEAVEFVIQNRAFDRLGIPEIAHETIIRAWENDPPALYGRFDLVYDGVHPPKMLEFNADTPTSLLEAAVVQWHWLQEMHPHADQWNWIWDALVAKWKDLKAEGFFASGHVHFACVDWLEDLMTTAVMMDTATEAGLTTTMLTMQEIRWEHEAKVFFDKSFRQIESIFKLYPWEYMLHEEFGKYALETYDQMHWMEPIWKMVLSNKGILPILWELFPGHENLLACYADGPRHLTHFAKKAMLGREGSNVILQTPEGKIESEGPYADSGFVYQDYAALPNFDGNHPIVGSWVVDGQACGMGIRESSSRITNDLARFVPHYFQPAKQG